MRVHVLGNVAVDEIFRVAVLPKPGQSVLADARTRDIGGKGANQAIVATRAGARVRLVTALGGDEPGRWAKRELAAEGLALDLTRHSGRTDASIIVADEGSENMIVTTHEAARQLTPQAVEASLALAEKGDVLALQGNLGADATGHALRLGRSLGLRTVLNPSPVRPGFSELWPFLDLLIVNVGEALELAATHDVEGAGRRLHQEGARQVVVTLGNAGALCVGDGGIVKVAAAPSAPVDTTGAGDTFAGVLVAVLVRTGAVDARTMAAAAEAAAVTVSRPGTRAAFPTRPELLAILARHGLG